MIIKQPRKMCHSHVSPCHSYILLLGKVVPLFVEITRDFVWEESMSSQQPLFSMSSFVTSLKIMKTAAKQANIQLQFLNSVTSMHLSPQVLMLKDRIPQTSCYFFNTQLLLDVFLGFIRTLPEG